MNITNFFTGFFGSKLDRDINQLEPVVEEINKVYESYKSLSDEEITHKTVEFRERLEAGEILDDIMVEAFALVKSVCYRLLGKTWDVMGHPYTWDMVPYDVQLMGGIILHQGKITEMITGEGKSLVAVLPLYLNALPGKGVHFVTVNDYLVQRDVEWYGPIYEFLGITIDYILNDMDTDRRRKAYNADITFGTNNEFGFDYLRDNMAIDKEDLVQRGHVFALVDEVDSVLIDEARTPLIISGPVSVSTHRYDEMKPLVQKIVRNQMDIVNQIVREGEQLLEEDEYKAGVKLLQAKRGIPKHKRLMNLMNEEGVKRQIARVENDFIRDKILHELDAELLFSVDEKSHTINLTDKGISSLSPQDQNLFELPDLSTELENIKLDDSLSENEKILASDKLHGEYASKNEQVRNVQQLLKAFTLFEKDIEYIVQDGKVMIVDEFTGRLMPGRRFSDGLHQALEAKENVKIERESQTLATITLQNYFRLYEKLAGMTGTAETEAPEFFEIYKLDVVVVPTNKPVKRIDYDDQIYRTRREKFNGIIDEIVRYHELNRPVLVGTVSVDASETLSRMLKRRGIPHNVLNAKYHQKEAEIIVRAGQIGVVTISTNMAGRGTDIKLGKGVLLCENGKCTVDRENPMSGRMPDGEDIPCFRDLPCGLHIIGTERHEARRIDRQLRGRSGRQGDPGSSKFYLSLEDDLMRLFGSERIAGIMDKLGIQEGEVITHSMVTKAIDRAQKRVEAHNFDIRKHLLEYDNVMNQQREVIYDRRNYVLVNDNVKSLVLEIMEETVETIVNSNTDEKLSAFDWEMEGLHEDIRNTFYLDFNISDEELHSMKQQELYDCLAETVNKTYENREAYLDPESLRRFEKMVILSVIDERWKEHLYEMDLLKEGIGLRAYGQKDPLLEYKSEGFELFISMLEDINKETLKILFRQTMLREPMYAQKQQKTQHVNLVHQSAGVFAGGGVAVQDNGGGRMGGSVPGTKQPAAIKKRPVKHTIPKVGRNDPCPCGSGKKYKKCCLLKEE